MMTLFNFFPDEFDKKHTMGVSL